MFSDNYFPNLIQEWRQTKESHLLSWLFCVFAAPKSDTKAQEEKRQVAAILAEYLREHSTARILQIESRLRQSTSMEWSIDWRLLRIEDFLTASMSAEERRAVTLFASFHCCGYVRQRAVRALPDYPDTLPFIALRMADWVVIEIRREARQAFARRLPQATDRELLDTLPVIERVKHCGDPQAYISMLAPRLAGNASLLERILTDPNVRIRRFGVSNLREFLPDEYNQLFIRRLTREPDPFLRQLMLRSLLDSEQDLRPYHALLLRDKYSKNRGLALSSLHALDPEAGASWARRMLLDRNAHVRNVAKPIVRRHDPTFDLDRFYRDRVEEYPVSCLVEIAAAGRCEELSAIERFLTDPQPAVCRAAMSAVMRLAPDRYAPQITEMLASPQPGIAKTAAQLLRRYRLYDADRIFEIQRHAASEHTKCRCIPLLFATPKWRSLIYLLRILGTGGEKTNHTCLLHIDQWIKWDNLSYLAITPSEREEILRLVDKKAAWLKSPESGWCDPLEKEWRSKVMADRLRFAAR